ncbi:sigma factor G inhibitor Gin [Virgibacillus sp. NKC19-3]|uniref:sigma factor G inhibitor Gin n=1 Tax=Virgibacillus saliphilus TaxID=2831674 RepID=UPI001C9B32B6|nr:sigma factor G inhibitor Gin [Virgibacillus sp. NKC19-3]
MIKQTNFLERCGICEEEKVKGIHLYTMFICSECEYNMIHTEPREEKYNYYLRKLKNVNKPKLYS